MNSFFGKMTIRDWVTAIGLIMSGAAFYYGTNYKFESLQQSMERLEKSNEKVESTIDRINSKFELEIQNLKNEVNANTMRMELLKQEVEYLKRK